MARKPKSENPAYSSLPSVDDLLRSQTATSLVETVGRKRLTDYARNVVQSLRNDLRMEDGSATKERLLAEAESRLSLEWHMSQTSGLRRAINATGVVIHTNLGRAPLSEAARQALIDASGYCNVEYDIVTGDRGKRGENVERMICNLTGAEDAIVVNNCAAAAYLVLTAFAVGRNVIISRGELVEIGGEFRVPDVLARSGVTLTEVGTTNRTKLADYEKAINDKTAMILKVHPSNYRIVGFTTSPDLKDLAALAHEKNILLVEDAGSGALRDLTGMGLSDEPVISESISAGADVVTFSGDKLLGGPQAGIIAGSKKCIDILRRDPLYRALRVSKLIYAALEATLESYLRGTETGDVPVLKMLSSDKQSLEQRCRLLIERLTNSNLKTEVATGRSAVGGGAAPLTQPESPLVLLSHSALSADELLAALRRSKIPIIARIVDDRVAIDLRTVAESEEEELFQALKNV